MGLVHHQSAEQINENIHRQTRRAAVGLAACLGCLLGVAGITAIEGMRVAEAAETTMTSRLQPQSVRSPQPQPSPTEETAQADPTGVYNLQAASTAAMPAWLPPLGIAGGGGAVAIGSILAMSATRRRRTAILAEDRTGENAEGYDIASEPDFVLYDFEKMARAADVRMDEACTTLEDDTDALEARLEELELQANSSLMCARLRSELNIRHLAVLADMGEDPLMALIYPAPC